MPFPQLGFSEVWLLRLFQHLPGDLLEAIRVGITAVGLLVADAQQCAARSPANVIIETSGDKSSYRNDPWMRVGIETEDEEALLYEQAPFAVMRHSFAPTSAQGAAGEQIRRTETLVNTACGDLFGMHAEELLARVGGHDLPEHLCELDHLLIILENLLNAAPNVRAYVQRLRVQFPGGQRYAQDHMRRTTGRKSARRTMKSYGRERPWKTCSRFLSPPEKSTPDFS